MSSPYSIVPGDPREHKRHVLGLADRNLLMPLQGREARYLKYYERNPLGPPSFFLARDARSQAFVGMAAAFPTRLRVFGELVPGAISGDFAVDDGHRGLGPSVALQRAVVSALGENGLRCAYGYPNEFSEPIIKRVGYVDVGRLSRFVKVLKSRIVLDAYTGSRWLARLGAAVSRVGVDPVLWVLSRERLYRRKPAFRVEQPDMFDDRFSDLWETTWRQHTITSERNAELLNWKYEKPGTGEGGGIFTIFSLIGNDDRVVGYVVYRVRNGVRHLVDVAFLPSRVVADALLSEFILDARKHGAAAITLLYLGSANLLTQRLRAFGFFRRTDESGLRVYVPGNSQLDADLVEGRNWYFLTGDADV
jgi:GNAT superfamily N-acetyltransferase